MSVSYTVFDDALELRYTSYPGTTKARRSGSRSPYAGCPAGMGRERLYWACLDCYRRCEVVVMASQATFWVCRTCLRLRCTSRGLEPFQRLHRRADAIYGRLGGSNDQDMV